MASFNNFRASALCVRATAPTVAAHLENSKTLQGWM